MRLRNTLLLGAALLLPVIPVRADSAWSRDKMTTQASVDLDGDGKADKIKLETFARSEDGIAKYRLSVNGAILQNRISVMGEDSPLFFIADINRKDRYKEIVVQTEGNNGDADGTIYWYDGRKIQRVATLDRWNQTYSGAGVVTVGYWYQSFWTQNRMFKLDRNHRLIEVPQKYHPVNKKGTVTQKLALRKQLRKAGNAATLPVGTKITVVKSDVKNEDDWYFVKAANGKSGWIRSEDVGMDTISGLPYAG